MTSSRCHNNVIPFSISFFGRQPCSQSTSRTDAVFFLRWPFFWNTSASPPTQVKTEYLSSLWCTTKTLQPSPPTPSYIARENWITVDSFAIDFICNCSRHPPHRPPPQKTLWGSNCKWVHCTSPLFDTQPLLNTYKVSSSREVLMPSSVPCQNDQKKVYCRRRCWRWT